ncbi:hemerythrin domain-containing protein [uncultured Tateyamaria sp.]|uniref:hemerythrin domain-containing protein n=1 Tax=uncultured Tateyamaria sp. TaxID=455651 RepID=UPI0026244A71|nr:hemerythrin domain-containing protein [uncultured Tateyamaria sp.]
MAGNSDLSAVPLENLSVEAGTRPHAPALPNATGAQRAKGRQLASIHAHYLQDMARLAAVIDRIEAGVAPPAHLAQIVLASDMAQNFAAFGNLCGQGCQMLTMHHNIEEQHMFPEIEGKATPFAALIARLREEHKVVHELLDRLAACSARLTRSPDAEGFAETRAVFAALHRAIQSHFGYEERELEAAIGVYVEQF